MTVLAHAADLLGRTIEYLHHGHLCNLLVDIGAQPRSALAHRFGRHAQHAPDPNIGGSTAGDDGGRNDAEHAIDLGQNQESAGNDGS